MPQKITGHLLQLMREGYERGDAKAELARNYGVSTTTVTKYAKDGGWKRPEDQEPEVDVGTPPGAAAAAYMMDDDAPDLPTRIVEGAVDPDEIPAIAEATSTAVAQTWADQQAELEELRRLNADLAAEKVRLQAKVDELRETRSVAIYENPDEVVSAIGYDHLRDVALKRLYANHRQQMGRFGYMPKDFASAEYAGEVEAEIHVVISELLRERTSHISPLKKCRVLKMVNPHTGSIVQVPMEEQINNMKGEQIAPLAKMRAKGFQLAEPFRCQRMDCWLPAKRDAITQKISLNGYCSPEQRAEDKYLSGTRVANVTTTASIGMKEY